ncbi:branched chain amino acid ABC transporter substrate-binding protein [Saccharibacillus sp. O23]|uniref:branched-chain amino acid ABC transporter substrate-binding protein n=1 Tax=Saccharibacillus sp. O23 TaxID=2009338 RepID=UPI000B4E82BF|nr:branched-chain amino acid ABC transporter substrate-binding protein [Saccharibacillus sp. O23]OWR31880.1 branched chain amino acid ABC transporter substrate-binding protein [Saccharibacillus sp. O23]
MKRKTLGFVSMALLMSLVTACGNSGGNPTANGSEAASSSGGAAGTVIKIATQSPLSGSSSIQGEAIRLGAQMALEDRAKEFKDLGFSLELVPYDDQGDAKKGVANSEMIGADQAVLGVIGHLNSGVSIPSSVVYEKYNIPMISPASTATEFTDRKLKVANRVVARDDFQGPAGAQYAVNELGAKNIFVIQDKTAYGQGLAEAFRDEAQKLGATIAGYEAITVGEKDFNGVLNIALSKKPDFIFFGGLYAEGGLLVKQAREKGITAPFMGGDALDSSGMVEIAGDSVKDSLYSSVATDITKSAEGKKWADRYKEKFSKNAEGYSVYAYDSMSVMLNAVKSAIDANGGKLPAREAVRDAVRATKDFKGVATEVSFDDIGDNVYAKVFIYKFETAAYPGSLVSEVSKQK